MNPDERLADAIEILRELVEHADEGTDPALTIEHARWFVLDNEEENS